METIYNVLKPHFIHVGIALDGGTVTYENGYLTMNFTIPFSPEELQEEITRISSIRSPETQDTPQYCLDALEYLKSIKTRLGWQ